MDSRTAANRASMTDSNPLDRRFAAFVRTGDPDHLAAVFDVAAPRLLLVAMHLTRDVAEAEDLVQTTFLEAIRGADRFEAGRSVLPWLVTILSRRAQDARRRRRAAGAADEPAADAAEPLAALAHEETLRAVSQALDGLPAHYHEVVSLRFVHGLKVVEIARALRRPVGTVQAQLHRGLAMLRRALPKSVALSMAALLAGTERGLAAVRTEVLRAAGAGLVASTAFGKLVMLGLLVLATGVGLWWMLPSSAAPSQLQDRSAAAGPIFEESDPREEQRIAVASSGSTAPVHERTGDPEPAADDPNVVRFSGRVVAAESGEPLEGVEMWFRQSWTNQDYTYIFGDGRYWLVEDHFVTGTDGRFAFAARLLHETGYQLNMQADRRIGRSGSITRLTDPLHADFGDVALHRGTRVTGRIRNRNGEGIEAGLHAEAPLPELRGLPGLDGFDLIGIAWSDDDGRIREGHTTAAGTWRLLSTSGEVLEPREIVVREGQDHIDLSVRLATAGPIAELAGRVIDRAGNPVARQAVRAWFPGSEDAFDSDSTDEAGRFVITARREEQLQPFHLGLAKGRIFSRFAGGAPERLWNWNGSEPVLTAQPASTTDLVVVDAAGTPIESFGLWLKASDERRSCYAHFGHHSEGRLSLPGLTDDVLSLTVIPERRDLRFATIHPTAEPQPRDCDVALVRGSPLEIALRSENRPVSGADVAMTRVSPVLRYLSDDSTAPLADARAWFQTGIGSGGQFVFDDRATSDASGRATLFVDSRWEPEEGEFALVIQHLTHESQVVPLSAEQIVTGRVEVELVAGGAILGRVVQPDLAGRFADRVGAGRQRDDGTFSRPEHGGPRNTPAWWAESPIAADGSFEFRGLPPGRWRLSLERHGRNFVHPDMPILDIEAGDTTTAILDPTSLAPATVRLHVTLDGRPAPEGRYASLTLLEDHPLLNLTSLDSEKFDRDGSVCFLDVPAGSYALFSGGVVNGVNDHRYSADVIVVAPGHDVEQRVDLPRRRLTLDLRAADGSPTGLWSGARYTGGAHPDIGPDGRTFAPLPGFDGVTLHLPRPDGGAPLVLGPFRIPDGQTTHHQIVQLPD